MSAQIIPVIVCGGAGTRLWPVSRESMPKQFVALVGQGSTFQQVLSRISEPSLFSRPIVITNADFRFVVAEQLRERGIEADIVLEPSRRDSGPAVAVSAVLAAERDRDALVLVLAADHVVRNPEEFREACRCAAEAATAGRIVTFGKPTHPATNYGYIRPGAKLKGSVVHAVDAFVEKPDAVTAATYVADGYLWNSGNFLFHAATMLTEIERFEPDMRGCQGGGQRPHPRSRFPAACARAVRARAEKIHRLCRHGAYQTRRRGSRRHRLVRCGQLGRGLGHSRSRRRRQCHRGPSGHARQPQQPGALGQGPY
jgi:mannose-1-phosphate guanylyltransferase/mannose-6-phosphate isomerase